MPKPTQEEPLPPPNTGGVEEPPSELGEVRQENENKRRRYLPGERLLKKLIKQQTEAKLRARIEKRLERLLI